MCLMTQTRVCVCPCLNRSAENLRWVERRDAVLMWCQSPLHTGYTPLHMASGYLHTPVVELLLAYGADPEVRCKVCETACVTVTKTSIQLAAAFKPACLCTPTGLAVGTHTA